MDGELPVNCSGGVLSSNPIGASGMLRFGEAALQVRGAAGEHQVDGARKALGHAYGGGSQFFAMWVVGSEKPTTSPVAAHPPGSIARPTQPTHQPAPPAPKLPPTDPPSPYPPGTPGSPPPPPRPRQATPPPPA